MERGVDVAAALVRSDTRIAILEVLEQRETVSKHELREQLDCSRTTVHRNLDQLAETGWIERTESGYSLTTSGAIVAEQAIDFVETAAAAARLQPVLRWIPRDELGIDLRALTDAAITVPGESNPLAMVDRHVQRLENATEIRALLPVTSRQPLEVQYQRTKRQEVTAELVISPSVADVIRSNPDFAAMTDEMRDLDRLSVFVTDEDVPYYLGILDETVQIGVDERGMPRALLETEAPTVRTWALEKYGEYRRSATPFSEWSATTEG